MKCAIATSLIVLVAAVPARAQVFQQTQYSVSHTFTLTPDPTATNVMVLVSDFRHAWARAGMLETWTAVSPVQLPDFDPFGTDTFTSPVSFNSGLLGVPVACQYDAYPVPPAGLNAFVCSQADLFPTIGTACNEWFIAPFGTTPPFVVQGSIESSGGAQAVTVGATASDAYGFSSTSIAVVGGIALANGQIVWGVSMDSDAVGGGAGASARVTRGDPIHFIATNLNSGTVVDAVLLDIDLDVPAQGEADWTAGTFSATADKVDLVIDIPPTYVAPGQGGHVTFRIDNGVVTESDDTGFFDGMLPAVGTATPLAFPLPDTFTLDYDLGLSPADPWDVELVLSGGAGSQATVVCLADLDGNGILNIDDIDAFIGFFLEGARAADLNGDGVHNIDDIDIFVAAFLAGCDPDVGG